MGRKLTVFMLDGTPIGPKTIEIGNWSGRAIYCPRASLKGLLNRNEFAAQGIYLLQSESDDEGFESSIYIGEAEELSARLKTHIADRDFESVVCFCSRDEALTKAHVKYLEAKLIQLARDANTSRVENSNSPRGARLSEADASDMDYFIEQIKLILPVVGIRSLVVAAPHSAAPHKAAIGEREYLIKSKDLKARMIEVDGGFVVRAGSEAAFETSKSIALGWLNIRKKLLDAGVLKQRGDRYVFSEDATFASPSAASSVVLGRQAPGPISWVLQDGRSYKDAQTEV
ncbi:MAG: GIY-YIG nuclease family protein [Alcaligenaceae bacterium]|nr:MAG: GIY-YIG nuclease family protein [Alcaligenaceae bacterium]